MRSITTCGGAIPCDCWRLVTFLFFNGGGRVSDSVVWAGIRHWGLLGRDPRGLGVVHVLAADRAVILQEKRDALATTAALKRTSACLQHSHCNG